MSTTASKPSIQYILRGRVHRRLQNEDRALVAHGGRREGWAPLLSGEAAMGNACLHKAGGVSTQRLWHALTVHKSFLKFFLNRHPCGRARCHIRVLLSTSLLLLDWSNFLLSAYQDARPCIELGRLFPSTVSGWFTHVGPDINKDWQHIWRNAFGSYATLALSYQ